MTTPPNLGCTVAPYDWWCSREPGHDGPCAARPASGTAAPIGYMVVATSEGYPSPVPQNGIWPSIDVCENYVAYCEGMAERDQQQRGWVPQQYRIVEVREMTKS